MRERGASVNMWERERGGANIQERSMTEWERNMSKYLPIPHHKLDVIQDQFKVEFSGFEFSFPSPRLVAIPRLKSPTIYPWLEGE